MDAIFNRTSIRKYKQESLKKLDNRNQEKIQKLYQ